MQFSRAFTFAVLIGALFAASAQESAPRESFKLKDADTRLGTNLARDVVTGSPVPLNKRYADLTAEQQRIVKSEYESMGENDEPPYPINGLAPIFRAIHQGQKKVLAEGPLVLYVDIDATGEATSVSIVQSPDPDLGKYAAGILLLHKYKPALCNGVACKMQFPFRVTMKTSL